MIIIYEEGDPCPVCREALITDIKQNEDEDTFIKCPVDNRHYSKFIGMQDDLNE